MVENRYWSDWAVNVETNALRDDHIIRFTLFATLPWLMN